MLVTFPVQTPKESQNLSDSLRFLSKSSVAPVQAIYAVLAVPCILDRISSQNTAGCSARRRIGVLEAVVIEDLTILKMIFRGLVTTVLLTEIVDSLNVPNGTDLREGSVAEYLHENDRPDTKTIVVCSLSELRCRSRAPL
jgi:hypothetical protein